MSIKTAGRFVTETELRTYTKCSQLHHYQGTITTEPLSNLTQYAFEALVSHSIRKEMLDPTLLIQKYLIRGVREHDYHNRYMDNQVLGFTRHATILLTEIFSIFPLNQYIPVTGPLKYNVQIHKTPVTLEVSGLFRSLKNQTAHVVCFSPYTDEHSAVNDPTTLLKLQTLKRLVKEHSSKRTQAKLHLFGIVESTSSLFYTSAESTNLNRNSIKQIQNIIKRMEDDHHYPLIPCLYSCPFKKKCNAYEH